LWVVLIAWVVWEQVSGTNPAIHPGGRWEPFHAFDSHSDCESLADHMNKEAGGIKHDRGYDYFVRYVCLPDTVDPRGPKGK